MQSSLRLAARACMFAALAAAASARTVRPPSRPGPAPIDPPFPARGSSRRSGAPARARWSTRARSSYGGFGPSASACAARRHDLRGRGIRVRCGYVPVDDGPVVLHAQSRTFPVDAEHLGFGIGTFVASSDAGTEGRFRGFNVP